MFIIIPSSLLILWLITFIIFFPLKYFNIIENNKDTISIIIKKQLKYHPLLTYRLYKTYLIAKDYFNKNYISVEQGIDNNLIWIIIHPNHKNEVFDIKSTIEDVYTKNILPDPNYIGLTIKTMLLCS